MKQGAEARVYRCLFFSKPAIVKERFPKSYRLPELDKKLTHRSASRYITLTHTLTFTHTHSHTHTHTHTHTGG